MPDWGWLVLGVLLFSAEMFLIDAQFYLVFLGAAAIVVGLVTWLGVPLPESGQWVLFAVLSLLAMLTFRKRLYEKLRKPQDTVPESLTVGDRVMLPESLAPGQTCRVEYRAPAGPRNIDQAALSGEVEIAMFEGLTLQVRRLFKSISSTNREKQDGYDVCRHCDCRAGDHHSGQDRSGGAAAECFGGGNLTLQPHLAGRFSYSGAVRRSCCLQYTLKEQARIFPNKSVSPRTMCRWAWTACCTCRCWTHAWLHGITNYQFAITQLAQTTLRSEIGKIDLDRPSRNAPPSTRM
jgi:membrane protein implicated in regulation of membrane protease activity